MRWDRNLLTLMAQVSSVSKSTIDSPPLASSALFGGLKRATTALRCQHIYSLAIFLVRYREPLMVLPEAALLLRDTVD